MADKNQADSRPRISKRSLERLDDLVQNEFGVEPDHISYEGKVQLLMGQFDVADDPTDHDDAPI